MSIWKNYHSLKKGAKRTFVALMITCLVSTGTGIGSVFAFADEVSDETLNTNDNTMPGADTASEEIVTDNVPGADQTDNQNTNQENGSSDGTQVPDTENTSTTEGTPSAGGESLPAASDDTSDENGDNASDTSSSTGDSLVPSQNDTETNSDTSDSSNTTSDENTVTVPNDNTDITAPENSEDTEDTDSIVSPDSYERNDYFSYGEEELFPEGLEETEYDISNSSHITIDGPSSVYYTEVESFSELFTLTYTSSGDELTEGSDYSCAITGAPSPLPEGDGRTVDVTYTFTGLTSTVKGTATRTVSCLIDNPQIQFNGSATMENAYYKSVYLSADDYYISLNQDGTYGSYVEYMGDNQPVTVYLKKELDGQPVKKEISGLTIVDAQLDETDIFETSPVIVSDALTYSGEEQALYSTEPVFNTIVVANSVDWTFRGAYSSVEDLNPGSIPYVIDNAGVKAKDAGSYNVYLYYSYSADISGTTVNYYGKKDCGSVTINKLNLSSGANFRRNTGTLSYATTDFANLYKVYISKGANVDGPQLIEKTDYTVTITAADTIPEAGSTTPIRVTATFTGIGTNVEGSYTEQIDCYADDVPIGFDGTTSMSSVYYDSVTLASSDYQISLDEGKTFADSYKYTKEGIGQTVVVYLKHKTTGVVVKKTITGLTLKVLDIKILLDGSEEIKSAYTDKVTISSPGFSVSVSGVANTFANKYVHDIIGENQTLTLTFSNGTDTVKRTISGINIISSDIPVLYNGSEKMQEQYINYVNISSNGYSVSDSADGPFENVYQFSKVGDDQKITLYFRNGSSGLVLKKTIEGLTIITAADSEEIGLPLKYNGEDKKDWYNKDVELTCSGYKISDSATANFKKSFTMSGSGKVSKVLYFKNESTKKVTTYTVSVQIDKKAPTGKVYVGDDYNSKKLVTSDELKLCVKSTEKVKISSSDDLSGVGTVQYAITEKLYTAASSLEEALKAESESWKTYNKNDKPKLIADKANYVYVKITDKAGNTTYISTGKVISDSKAPEMKILTIQKEASGTITIAVTATDELSGVDSFYLRYFETTEDLKLPEIEDIVNNGEKATAEKIEDGTWGGRYSLTQLDKKKPYTFFVVPKDKAGNVGVYKKDELKVDPNALAEDEAASQAGGSGSGELEPAPNGIAGGGGGSQDGAEGSGGAGGAGGAGGTGGSGSGNGGSSQSDASAGNGSDAGDDGSGLGDLDREISRTPYIAEATGSTKIGQSATGGWKKITDEIKIAETGTSLKIEMSGTKDVPGNIIQEMAGRKLRVSFLMSDGVEWEISGENVPEGTQIDRNFGVRLQSRNIPSTMIQEVADAYPHTEFTLNDDSKMAYQAKLRIPVGATNAGMFGNLYAYDSASGELKLVQSAPVNSEGYVEYEGMEAADYTIVVKDKPMMSQTGDSIETNVLTAADATALAEYEEPSITIPDLFGLKGTVRIWMFAIAIISAVLCVVILFQPGLHQYEDERNRH